MSGTTSAGTAQTLTDEWIGAQINALPDSISFVTPYFAFARNVESETRKHLAAEAQQLREQRDDLLVLLKTVDAEGLIPDGFRLLRASVRALIARVEAA